MLDTFLLYKKFSVVQLLLVCNLLNTLLSIIVKNCGISILIRSI
jgi:hypothetical protein